MRRAGATVALMVAEVMDKRAETLKAMGASESAFARSRVAGAGPPSGDLAPGQRPRPLLAAFGDVDA